MDLKQFGLYFSSLRERSGFSSQRQLAIASGVSNGTIARIESGTQKPTPETLLALSKHLKNTSYIDLLVKVGYLDHLTEEQKSKFTTYANAKGIIAITFGLIKRYRKNPNHQEEIHPEIIDIVKDFCVKNDVYFDEYNLVINPVNEIEQILQRYGIDTREYDEVEYPGGLSAFKQTDSYLDDDLSGKELFSYLRKENAMLKRELAESTAGRAYMGGDQSISDEDRRKIDEVFMEARIKQALSGNKLIMNGYVMECTEAEARYLKQQLQFLRDFENKEK